MRRPAPRAPTRREPGRTRIWITGGPSPARHSIVTAGASTPHSAGRGRRAAISVNAASGSVRAPPATAATARPAQKNTAPPAGGSTDPTIQTRAVLTTTPGETATALTSHLGVIITTTLFDLFRPRPRRINMPAG